MRVGVRPDVLLLAYFPAFVVIAFSPRGSRPIIRPSQDSRVTIHLRLPWSPPSLEEADLSKFDDRPKLVLSRDGVTTNNFTVAATTSSATTSSAVGRQDDSQILIPSPAAITMSPKFRRLKDLMWFRDAQEDLTAAEFAASLDPFMESTSAKKRRRAVDYDKLLSQLDRRLVDMGCELVQQRITDARHRLNVTFAKPPPGEGMGSVVYTQEQREALYSRMLGTRYSLTENMIGHEVHHSQDKQSLLDFSMPDLQLKIISNSSSEGVPKLYVRADGTIEWDGALQDRAGMRAFGTAVWARINGQDPKSIETVNGDDAGDTVDGDTSKKSNSTTTTTTADASSETESGEQDYDAKSAVTAKIEETEAIRREKAKLNGLETELEKMEQDHTRLLNSAISAGQAIANINLANLDPDLRERIRVSSESLEFQREQVSYQRLFYELERIYTYLAGDIGSPFAKGTVPLQDRLNIAEFGLLESQIETFNRQLQAGVGIDADILKVVLDQVTDFKGRLGIDYYVTGLTYDSKAIQLWIQEQFTKTRKGLAFYVKGCQLLWNDIVFCFFLFGRAAQGYTLKPREVRNLRRTLRDFITFIPFVIILLIPLSPIGHVLVFGAIQKVFPDFFPSCFTERRQNLLELYESTEYQELTIKENWREKLVRFAEALAFLVASAFRKLVSRATRQGKNTNSTTDSSDASQ